MDDRLTRLIDSYCELWNEPDAGKRLRLANEVLAPDAVYADPGVETRSPLELVTHISAVIASRPGVSVKRCSEIDAHHAYARFDWAAVGTGGIVLKSGVDFVLLAAGSTRLQSICGFVGALPR